MKLRYILENNVNHYVEIQLDKTAKTGKIVYTDGLGGVPLETGDSIASILDTHLDIDPRVQVFKKGSLWDLYVFKITSAGEEVGVLISLTLPIDATPTELRFLNDSIFDVTLGDYIIQPLDEYNRPISDPPTGIEVTAYPFDQGIELQWTFVNDPSVAGYHVYVDNQRMTRSDGSGGMTDLFLGTNTSFSGLTNGTEYTIEVATVDSSGLELERSAPITATPIVA